MPCGVIAAIVRMLEGDAEHQHHEAAEPDLPGDHHQRRHRQDLAVQHIAERKQDGAGQRQRNADQLAGAEGGDIGAEQQRDAGDAEHQRRDIAKRRPFVQERPGEQHGPDRHGVGDERALADA